MHKRVYSSVERAVGGGKNAHSQAENRYDSYSSENERDPQTAKGSQRYRQLVHKLFYEARYCAKF